MDNLCFNCFFKYYHICMILFNLLIIHAYHVFADPSVKNDEPGFHSLLKSDITVAATEPAYLHCKVENQGLYQTAWIRLADRQVLSVDNVLVTNDNRFQVSHRKRSNDWCLIIKHTVEKDSGTYECILSTDPPKRFSVRLNIVENEITISGSKEVDEGDTIIIKCRVSNVVHNGHLPSAVWWYANNTIISFIQNDRFQKSTQSVENGLVSELRIADARPWDSAIYSCEGNNTPRRFIEINVKGNDNTYSNQNGISKTQPLSSSANQKQNLYSFLVLFVLLFVY
ncbi:Zwei Ig domain protein [Trichinella spiralis]|uniref:Zwei Ig domain protein n=1 Tax=Trichinella spiralis TaxID=6334 RepID=A0ABR3KS20_TRISP